MREIRRTTRFKRDYKAAITREYDRLLFCFNGPIAGEVVLGLDGNYLSGTYKMSSSAWPY